MKEKMQDKAKTTDKNEGKIEDKRENKIKEKIMKRIKRLWESSDIWTAVLCMLLLLAVAAPMTYIARYVWPCSDDFEMSLWCKKALDETGSIFQVIKRAGDYAIYKWQAWEGTFSSIFLMALQPGIWGDRYYPLGVVFLIAGLLISIFTLTYVLMVKQAGASRAVWLILTALPTWAWFFRAMYTEEAFYWWTGASNYTGFHSWVMLLLALAFCIYTDWESYGRVKKTLLCFVCVLCFFLGGGNYLSAMLQVLVLAGLSAGALITKKKSGGILAAYTLSALGGLLLSALAPGNKTHMSHDIQSDISAVEAIFIAIRDGLEDIGQWTNLSVILLFVFLLPFAWKLARGCSCRFRFPLLATILSGGLFLAEYAPTSYSYGGYEPGRIINLYYWNYYWLLLFNVIYWVGWLDRKLDKVCGKKLEQAAASRKIWQPVYIMLAGVALLAAVNSFGIKNSNFYWVCIELKNRNYQYVDQFMEERTEYFREHQGEDVVIPEIPYKSTITYFGDIFPDSGHLVNTTMAEYYGVKSITMAP